MKEQLVEQIRDHVVPELTAQAREALIKASDHVLGREGAQSDSSRLHEKLDTICERFAEFLRLNFDTLIKPDASKLSLLKGSSLSLVDDVDMAIANMLEGMVAYCRNLHIKEYMAFTNRFGALFYSTRIDESNNPLDPEQICRALSDALTPLKLASRHEHAVYQRFNQEVLRNLGELLEQASQILVANQVKPSLDVFVRNRDTVFGKRKGRRPDTNPAERAFDLDGPQNSTESEASLSELFGIVRRCLDGDEPATKGSALSQLLARNEQGQLLALPAKPLAGKVAGEGVIPDHGMVTLRVPSGSSIGNHKLRKLSREQLLAVYSEGRGSLPSEPGEIAAHDHRNSSLLDVVCDHLLAEGKSIELLGIDPGVKQDVEILSLFYQAVADDAALAFPLKSLVDKTRSAALKLALKDSDFFSRDSNSLASLINEIGDTGFGWTDPAQLQNDASFIKLSKLVGKLDTAESVDEGLVAALLEELRAFRSAIPESALESVEQQNRLQLVRQIARQKLQERLVGDLDPTVDEILNTHFQRFMEKLLLREGAGGSSWKYVIETIDKLLWTLQKEKDPADRNLFEKINPRITSNIEKVLRTAGVCGDKTTELLDRLLKLQLAAFEQAERSDRDLTAIETARQVFDQAADSREAGAASDDALSRTILADNSEYLKQVDKLPVGTWVEFTVPGEPNTRCTLAGRMGDGGEFYFVSRHGVRMIEKTRAGLARELKDGSARIVGEWPLFNRTLEAVIARLRNSKKESETPDKQ